MSRTVPQLSENSRSLPVTPPAAAMYRAIRLQGPVGRGPALSATPPYTSRASCPAIIGAPRSSPASLLRSYSRTAVALPALLRHQSPRLRSPELSNICRNSCCPPSASSRYFSSSPRIMVAEKIDGTAIAKAIRAKIHVDIAEQQKLNPRFRPALTIVQGERHFHLFVVNKY